MIYSVSSRSVVQGSDPIPHISLRCTVASRCPSVPNITVCIPKNPQNAHPSPLPPLFLARNPKVALLGRDLFLFFVLDWIICSVFQILYVSDTWYLSFSFWLASLNRRISRYIHIAANGISLSLLWLSNIPMCVCVCRIFLIHSSLRDI